MADDQFNMNGLTPLSQTPTPANAITPTGTDGYNLTGIQPVNPAQYQQAQEEEKYGSVGQQALTVAEGLGHGFAGPVATAAEASLSKLGVPGLSPAEQQARAETNPLTRYGTEAAGFIAGDVSGVGEAALLGRIGEAAKAASGLGRGAGLISKIAGTGIKGAAELSALQAGDEASKFINQDPNQTLGSAAINIGLAGILGTVGGATLGSVSPFFQTAANKLGVSKFATEFQGELGFLQDLGRPSAEAAANEVTTRMGEADQILNGGLKGQAIARSFPEATEEVTAKADKQLQEISAQAAQRIEAASKNAYLKSSVPRLTQDLTDFQEAIGNQNATLADKFDALNDYKIASQKHANYNTLVGGPDEAALSKWIKPFNATLREAAENSNIWGKAGDIQKSVNAAVSDLYAAQKDFLQKATSKELGERVADPNKLETMLNQVNKGKGAIKSNAVRNYLDATQDAADAINTAHINAGLEPPLNLKDTPVLSRAVNEPLSAGRSAAQWAYKNGADALAKKSGELVGGGFGTGLGALVGHPLIGGALGVRYLGPMMSQLAKPFAESAVNSEAARASVDYISNALKGESTLNKTISNVLKAGKTLELIPKELLPDQSSRKKLEKSLEAMNVPENAMKVGGNIGHYLPDHASAASSIAAQAKNYLDAIKPKPIDVGPLDPPAPLDKNQTYLYNRALDIAQQPLMVLQHIRNSTLMPGDVTALNTIYPGLAKAMSAKLMDEVIQHHAEGHQIPYSQRVAIQMLTGTPLNSQDAINVPAMVQPAQAQQTKPKATQKPATSVALKQIDKTNALYANDLNQRQIDKRI